MNESEEKLCLDNIEEFLMDHSKIVTSKYLSRSLNIPTNDAKRLLAKYASTSDQKSNLSATFTVGGELKDNGGFSVTIAHDKDLDSVKSQFEKVLWEELYSLQKVGQLTDLNTLHIVNNVNSVDENETSLVGISYWKDSKRDDTATRNAVMGTVPANTKPELKSDIKQTVSPLKVAQPPRTPPKTPPKVSAKAKTSPSPKKEVGTKSKSAGNKPGGIAAMFAAQQTKKDTAPKSKAKPEPAKKGSQNISSFFTGQSRAPAKKESKAEPTSTECDTQEEDVTGEKDSQSTESQESLPKVNGRKEITQAPKNVSNKKGSQADKSKDSTPKVNKKEENNEDSKNVTLAKKPAPNKKKNQSQKKSNKGKSSEPPQKRRKRVMIESDSENSSEGDSDAESERSISPELERPPSPQPMEEDDEVIPATPVESTKKRKRKTIDKTALDENGFLCTTKEYVYESCSDNDENEENKKTNANSDTKEVAKPDKSPEMKKVGKPPTKQQSLTCFFKKK